MVFCFKVLGKVVGQIFLARVPCDVDISEGNLVCDVEKCISMARDCCFLTVSFSVPTAVMLSQWTGVGG
jgi:hypothetical protein